MSNMHLFDEAGRLRKYTLDEIVDAHGRARLKAYDARLAHEIQEAERALVVAQNKAAYVEAVRTGRISLVSLPGDEALSDALIAAGLPPLPEAAYLVDLPTRALTEAHAQRYTRTAERLQRSWKICAPPRPTTCGAASCASGASPWPSTHRLRPPSATATGPTAAPTGRTAKRKKSGAAAVTKRVRG